MPSAVNSTCSNGAADATAQREAPAPEYVLRAHEAQINCIAFVDSANLLLSGDADGYVAVWSLDTFRPLAFARVHDGSILTVGSWAFGSRLLTHGRDNNMHVFDLAAIVRNLEPVKPSMASPSSMTPLFTIETNALGYCKCAIQELDADEALVAVPSTLDDNLADIFHLPSGNRIHRSIGKNLFQSKTGTVMSLQLSTSGRGNLLLVVAYESGKLAVFSHAESRPKEHNRWMDENEGWRKVSERHAHKEPIMGLCLDTSNETAWSVSADHLVVRYNAIESSETDARAFKTAHPGRGAIAVRDDGRILATAGWDGRVRIHSAASFKPLAVLEHHRDSLYAVAFQNTVTRESMISSKTADEGTPDSRSSQFWLAAGGADQRISLWRIYPPAPT